MHQPFIWICPQNYCIFYCCCLFFLLNFYFIYIFVSFYSKRKLAHSNSGWLKNCVYFSIEILYRRTRIVLYYIYEFVGFKFTFIYVFQICSKANNFVKVKFVCILFCSHSHLFWMPLEKAYKRQTPLRLMNHFFSYRYKETERDLIGAIKHLCCFFQFL